LRNLFWDLFMRMVVIVTVFDVLAYYYSVVRSPPWNPVTLTVFILLEIIVITLSLWFDIRYRKLKDE
jgi:hypothetical protein